MKPGRRLSFKRQVQCSNIQVQKQSRFLIKNEAGPKAQLQKDKSSAPTSKSRNDNDFLLKMKLGRRPSFKRTSPMLQHPSPETIMISYWRWSRAEGSASKDKSNAPTSKSRNNHDFSLKMKLGRRPSFKRTSPVLQHPSPETITISY